MTTALTTFDFHGDRLDVVQDGETIWVSVRRISEALGIDEEPQRKKLKRKAWAVTSLKEATGPDGKTYETFCISHRSLPMWLATIEPSRSTAPELADKLRRFQTEAADVLADHFLGRRGDRNDDALRAEIAELRTMVYALTCRTIEAAKPSIGPGAARTYVLDPLREIARIRARAVGKTSASAVLSMRASAERALRRELAFPPDRNQRWELFPASRLGEACCVIARMHGDALELARVASGSAKQTRLALVRA